MSRYTREECISLLCGMQKKLLLEGNKRLPKRSDFSEEETAAIKAFFGPWPRALELAGIKEERGIEGSRIERNREKRIRAKRMRNLERKKRGKTKI